MTIQEITHKNIMVSQGVIFKGLSVQMTPTHPAS